MQLILFGPPGVGKGTQARIISKELNIPHISTGDILREAVTEKTELGLKAQEIMQRGELVSDDIMIGIIRNVLEQPRCNNGSILDGYPRTVNQADSLIKLFKELNIKDFKLINIEADEKELVRRITNRRTCSNCNSIFNYSEIKDIVKCPNCGAENSFFQRKDDKEEVIKKRLEVYKNTTSPVLQFFEKYKVTLNVDGTKSIDEVTREILKGLKR